MFWQTFESDVFSAIFCCRLDYIDKCIIVRHLGSDILLLQKKIATHFAVVHVHIERMFYPSLCLLFTK